MTWCAPQDVAETLASRHYLGPSARGIAWSDEFGVMIFAKPTARNVPADWLELVRWCITAGPNSGSRQWRAVRRALLVRYPGLTTVISYSDPSVGHTGALYRACGWLWAPTWHRLRPPPTGNGSWRAGRAQAVKDRWVATLRADAAREPILVARDEACLKRYPWARYTEPHGADYKRHMQARA